jgi:hypothetical protein
VAGANVVILNMKEPLQFNSLFKPVMHKKQKSRNG